LPELEGKFFPRRFPAAGTDIITEQLMALTEDLERS
jgi:hypothetical protein